MNREYSIPLVEIRREHIVVNSRFIAALAPVFSTEEARAFIARIKKEFADASHNVPAYIIGGREYGTLQSVFLNMPNFR